MSASLDELVCVPFSVVGNPAGDKARPSPEDQTMAAVVKPDDNIGMVGHTPKLVPFGILF